MKQYNVIRHLERFGFMPGSTITALQDHILRILFGKYLKKDIHAHCKENSLDPYRYLCYVLKTAPSFDQTQPDWALPLMPANALMIAAFPNIYYDSLAGTLFQIGSPFLYAAMFDSYL